MHRQIYFLAIALLLASCRSDSKMLQVIKLNDYPSASAIEYVNGRYFIMGDDSKQLLILNSKLEVTDSISMYTFAEKRMAKPTKADMESMAITGKKQLLLLGSGSLPPYRNGGWLIDPVTKRKDSIILDTIYKRLHNAGLKVINIEGACSIPGGILLANRGNYAWRNNHLAVLKDDFWKDQDSTTINIIRVGVHTDTAVYNGVSGLAYAPKSDRLLCTVSTEKTYSNTADGTIGKSYLWIIDNISSKKNWKAVNPNRIIDLEAMNPQFAGQKIESVCVSRETSTALELVLTADNDDGSSTVFKIVILK